MLRDGWRNGTPESGEQLTTGHGHGVGIEHLEWALPPTWAARRLGPTRGRERRAWCPPLHNLTHARRGRHRIKGLGQGDQLRVEAHAHIQVGGGQEREPRGGIERADPVAHVQRCLSEAPHSWREGSRVFIHVQGGDPQERGLIELGGPALHAWVGAA